MEEEKKIEKKTPKSRWVPVASSPPLSSTASHYPLMPLRKNKRKRKEEEREEESIDDLKEKVGFRCTITPSPSPSASNSPPMSPPSLSLQIKAQPCLIPGCIFILVLELVLRQFGTEDNLAPQSKSGQFGTMDNLTPQCKSGQLGTRTTWHQDNLAP